MFGLEKILKNIKTNRHSFRARHTIYPILLLAALAYTTLQKKAEAEIETTTSLTLSWKAPEKYQDNTPIPLNALIYVVEISPNSGLLWSPSSPVESTTMTIEGLDPSKTWNLRVKAIDRQFKYASDPSPEISITESDLSLVGTSNIPDQLKNRKLHRNDNIPPNCTEDDLSTILEKTSGRYYRRSLHSPADFFELTFDLSFLSGAVSNENAVINLFYRDQGEIKKWGASPLEEDYTCSFEIGKQPFITSPDDLIATLLIDWEAFFYLPLTYTIEGPDNYSVTYITLDNKALAARNSEIDSDGDGLGNHLELIISYTDPNLADTDEDGINDGTEYLMESDPTRDDITPHFAITISFYKDGSDSYPTITGHGIEGVTYTTTRYTNLLDAAGEIVDQFKASETGTQIFYVDMNPPEDQPKNASYKVTADTEAKSKE